MTPASGGTKKKPKNGSANVSFTVNREANVTADQIVFLLPQNFKLSGMGFKYCPASKINDGGTIDDCPKGSKVGTGSAVAYAGSTRIDYVIDDLRGVQERDHDEPLGQRDRAGADGHHLQGRRHRRRRRPDLRAEDHHRHPEAGPAADRRPVLGHHRGQGEARPGHRQEDRHQEGPPQRQARQEEGQGHDLLRGRQRLPGSDKTHDFGVRLPLRPEPEPAGPGWRPRRTIEGACGS